jgi:hypothetical protein
MGKRKRKASVALEGQDVETPPKGCHHYEEIWEVPWDIQKFALNST